MVKQKNDILLCLDVEATCYPDGAFPPGERQEIIEIGVCALDLGRLLPLYVDRIGVLPQSSSVSPYCTALTSITPEDAASAPPFAAAGLRLRDTHLMHRRAWASWGQFDERLLAAQMAAVGHPPMVVARHLNAKTWVAVQMGWPKELGLVKAAAALALPFVGRNHSGKDDAAMVATILAHVIGLGRSERN